MNLIDNRLGALDGTVILGTNGNDLILLSNAGNQVKAKNGDDFIQRQKGDNDQIDGGTGIDICFDMKNFSSEIDCEITDIQ